MGHVPFETLALVARGGGEAPAFAARVLFPWVFPFAFVAEAALCLWLLMKGVDIPGRDGLVREVR